VNPCNDATYRRIDLLEREKQRYINEFRVAYEGVIGRKCIPVKPAVSYKLMRKCLDNYEHGGFFSQNIRQQDLSEGQWGAIAPYWCEGWTGRNMVTYDCGKVWERPETVQTERETRETPAEYEWVCPNCGMHDIFEYENPPLGFTVTNRRVVKR